MSDTKAVRDRLLAETGSKAGLLELVGHMLAGAESACPTTTVGQPEATAPTARPKPDRRKEA